MVIEQHWARKLSSISPSTKRTSKRWQAILLSNSPSFGLLAVIRYGKGQRIIRTPDGTTHIFMGEAFSQSKLLETTPFGLTWKRLKWRFVLDQWAYTTNNLDSSIKCITWLFLEKMNVVLFGGTNIIMPPNSHESARSLRKVYGASFCSDSKGTIHAVFEVHLNNGDSEFLGLISVVSKMRKNHCCRALFVYDWIGRETHQHSRKWWRFACWYFVWFGGHLQ